MKKHLISIALVSALTSASSHADIQLSGFASVVGGMTTSKDESLYGYDDNFDFKEGSLFALQASSDLGNGLGVTVQLEAKGKDEWKPDFKWAYVSYDATDNLRLLAGRQRAPFYMYSDFLDVSYAYAWIEPPRGVYDLIFDTFDGLGAVYTTNFGDVDASFHGVYGSNTDDISAFGESFTPQISDLVGLATTFNYDWLTFRAAYFQADVTMPINSLNGLAQNWDGYSDAYANPDFADIANHTEIEEDTGTFLELGFQINYDAIVVVGEYTQLEIANTPLAAEDSFYIMAGYQFDQVLVHLTYGVDDNSNETYTSAAPDGLPIIGGDGQPIANTDLKGATDGVVMGQISETNYVTAGVRYDFHDSAALKFEYTTYTNDLNSNGDAGLFRVALVTVF